MVPVIVISLSSWRKFQWTYSVLFHLIQSEFHVQWMGITNDHNHLQLLHLESLQQLYFDPLEVSLMHSSLTVHHQRQRKL